MILIGVVVVLWQLLGSRLPPQPEILPRRAIASADEKLLTLHLFSQVCAARQGRTLFPYFSAVNCQLFNNKVMMLSRCGYLSQGLELPLLEIVHFIELLANTHRIIVSHPRDKIDRVHINMMQRPISFWLMTAH
jgi:hypothetical protein